MRETKSSGHGHTVDPSRLHDSLDLCQVHFHFFGIEVFHKVFRVAVVNGSIPKGKPAAQIQQEAHGAAPNAIYPGPPWVVRIAAPKHESQVLTALKALDTKALPGHPTVHPHDNHARFKRGLMQTVAWNSCDITEPPTE
jgi:hypothetical protein